MKKLIKNLTNIYSDEQKLANPKDTKEKFYIIIEDKYIKEINSGNPSIPLDEFDEIIDGKNMVALPGLINCHTHVGMNLFRGVADDLPLQTWLEDNIWPLEAKLTAEDVYWGSLHAIMEMISRGITTFCDMYFYMDQVAEAAKKAGIRAVLGQGLIEENDGEKGLNQAVRFAQKWDNSAEGKISTVLSPHAPYTCSSSYLCDIISISEKNDLPLNIHLAETKQEKNQIKEKYGLTPVRYLADIGFLDRPVTAAHCVHVDKQEIKILAEKEVGVAHNVASNMKLGSGIAPLKDMLAVGVNVGLGTDGAASNNNLDLIEEARMASYLQKVDNQDPTVVGLEEILSLLTVDAARVLGLEKTGKLQENFLADIILLDMYKNINSFPHHNTLSNIFYSGNGNLVDTVFINGKKIMENREFIFLSLNKVNQKVEERARGLVE